MTNVETEEKTQSQEQEGGRDVSGRGRGKGRGKEDVEVLEEERGGGVRDGAGERRCRRGWNEGEDLKYRWRSLRRECEKEGGVGERDRNGDGGIE